MSDREGSLGEGLPSHVRREDLKKEIEDLDFALQEATMALEDVHVESTKSSFQEKNQAHTPLMETQRPSVSGELFDPVTEDSPLEFDENTFAYELQKKFEEEVQTSVKAELSKSSSTLQDEVSRLQNTIEKERAISEVYEEELAKLKKQRKEDQQTILKLKGDYEMEKETRVAELTERVQELLKCNEVLLSEKMTFVLKQDMLLRENTMYYEKIEVLEDMLEAVKRGSLVPPLLSSRMNQIDAGIKEVRRRAEEKQSLIAKAADLRKKTLEGSNQQEIHDKAQANKGEVKGHRPKSTIRIGTTDVDEDDGVGEEDLILPDANGMPRSSGIPTRKGSEGGISESKGSSWLPGWIKQKLNTRPQNSPPVEKVEKTEETDQCFQSNSVKWTKEITDEDTLEFCRIFEVPTDDKLVEVYSCAMDKVILVQGWVYISRHYLCFRSSVFSGFGLTEFKEVIPLDSIKSLSKKNTAFIIPNAIQVDTPTRKYFFSMFMARDETFELLDYLWKGHINLDTANVAEPCQPALSNPLVDEPTGDINTETSLPEDSCSNSAPEDDVYTPSRPGYAVLQNNFADGEEYTDMYFAEGKIGRGDSFLVEFDVTEPGSLIGWAFKCNDKDVGFLLQYCEESSNATSLPGAAPIGVVHAVMPMRRIHSSLGLIAGKFVAKLTGKYILRWDNTYSMWHTKILKYRTYLEHPSGDHQKEIIGRVEPSTPQKLDIPSG